MINISTLRLFCVVFMLMLFSSNLLAQDSTPEATEAAPMLMGMDTACEAPVNLSGSVTIGAVFGQTEAISVYGIPQTQAVELAVGQINEYGFLGEGVTLEVIFQDSGASPEGAITAMTQLVEVDGVSAILGPTLSSQAFAADPIAQEAGIPVMGVSNTAGGITDMGDFVFRNSLPESAVIPGTITTATEVLGLEAVGVLYGNDDDFTVSGYNVFVEALDANGVDILGEETFAKGDTDYSAQLTNLIGLEPDALVVSALAAEAVQIITQARQQGYTGPIIGGNGFNSPAVIEQSGEASEGVIVGAAWNIASSAPLSVAFSDTFTAAYGNAPDQFAAQAYSGAWILAEAIRCADSADPTAIRDALAAVVDFDTPLGSFSFDENRNPVHDPVVQIVQDRAFAVLSAETDGEG